MNAIVVVDKNWAIGHENDLLFSLPGDMKHFRTLTTGGTVIMGRKTLDSFPEGKPLPNRRNIVITRNEDFQREGCEIVGSPEAALELAAGDNYQGLLDEEGNVPTEDTSSAE
jgi:dihydrofolate reductase